MKLNPDCVKDVLLSIEENVGLEEHLRNINELKLSDLYSDEDITYTLLKLDEANFIHFSHTSGSNSFYSLSIGNMTYEGHNFLDTVRDPSRWEKVKQKAASVGGVSIPILQQLGALLLEKQLNS
ncbi:Uncharacterised protein [Listeria grayi]|uniref:DUF2513 domain-containing protein n=1 Tax=Listeria grayi FSL F6-1183 TaxID=1265827 RepID=A0A829R586_LISGR|nr:DUF2513 domain-containing protein [Listeria grayi]EUJ27768.1 hypothetical protein LMUR_09584 [Listeria grayi FSL F6-1183]VEI34801.1 Uncharacterised protein [Listeria grayi]